MTYKEVEALVEAKDFDQLVTVYNEDDKISGEARRFDEQWDLCTLTAHFYPESNVCHTLEYERRSTRQQNDVLAKRLVKSEDGITVTDMY